MQKECHMVKSEKVGNLLGMMMDGANYCADGWIADLHNSAEVWVSYG